MIITIDGPVASGKSTVGRELAKKLEFYFIGSGVLYRALAYLLINHEEYTEKDMQQPKQEDLARYLDFERFKYRYTGEYKEQVLFDRLDVTPFLKTTIVDTAASILSTNAIVRGQVNTILLNLSQMYDVVVEGRDIGSVVFPHADMKVFLTADEKVRAGRWQKVMEKKGFSFTLEQALQMINERDTRDQERAIAPLTIPQGAIIVDNSAMNVEETVEKIIELLRHNRIIQ